MSAHEGGLADEVARCRKRLHELEGTVRGLVFKVRRLAEQRAELADELEKCAAEVRGLVDDARLAAELAKRARNHRRDTYSLGELVFAAVVGLSALGTLILTAVHG